MFESVKRLLGVFSLTQYERDIVQAVRDCLRDEEKRVLDDQMSRFNRVERVMWDDERIGYGSSTFYQMKSGRSVLDYPHRFDAGPGERNLAVLEIGDGDNRIRVEAKLLDGIFVALHFFSKRRVFTPGANSVVESVRRSLPE